MNDIHHAQLSHFEIVRTIGQGKDLILGAFGTVKIAKKLQGKGLVAIKCLKKYELIKNKQVDHVHNEITIMSQLNHPFLTRFEGFCQDEKYIYIIMEFVQGGEFFIYLRNQEKFIPQVASFYGLQVALMFAHMHSRDIVYRDLKPENILFDTDGYLKLTDFGFAKVVTSRTYTLCGTPEYLAPEIILNQGHGKPVDWWTLGVLIYEMVNGIDPFYNADPMQIYQNILKSNIKFPNDFDQDAKSLVRHLLVSDLSKRYGNLKGAQDVINHKFFKLYDVQKLSNKQLTAPYKPKCRGAMDDQNFQQYPENDGRVLSVDKQNDPFLNW